jgi:hypothetical protein
MFRVNSFFRNSIYNDAVDMVGKVFAIFLIFVQKPLDIVYKFPYNSRPQTLIGLELRQEV